MSDQPAEERKKKKKHKKHRDRDRERDTHHSIKEQYHDSLLESIHDDYSGQCFIDQTQNNDNESEPGTKSLKIKFKFGQSTTTATTTTSSAAFSPNSDSNSIPNIKILTKSPLILSPNDDSRLSASHEHDRSTVNQCNNTETLSEQFSVKKEKKDKKKKKHKKHHHHHKHHKSKSENTETVAETNESNIVEDNSNKKLSPQIYTFTNKIKLSLDNRDKDLDDEDDDDEDDDVAVAAAAAAEEDVNDEKDIVLVKAPEEEIKDEQSIEQQPKIDKKDKKDKREKKDKKERKDKKNDGKTCAGNSVGEKPESMDIDEIVSQNNNLEHPLSVDIGHESVAGSSSADIKSETTSSPVTNKVPEIKLKLSKSGATQQYCSTMSSPQLEKFVHDNSSPKSNRISSPIPSSSQSVDPTLCVTKEDIASEISEAILEDSFVSQTSVKKDTVQDSEIHEPETIVKEQPVSPLILSIPPKLSPSIAVIVTGTTSSTTITTSITETASTTNSTSISSSLSSSSSSSSTTTTTAATSIFSSSTTTPTMTATSSSATPIISTEKLSTISPKIQQQTKKKDAPAKGFNALLQYLLKQLQKKDADGFFALPVSDSIAPSYSTIITNPMDLYTISKKIQSFQYSTLGDFRYDVKLMVDNAMKYNQSDTIYYKAASKLWHFNKQKLFKKDALTDYAKHYELSPQELSLNLSKKGGKTNFDSGKQSYFDNTGLFMDANCTPFTGLNDDPSSGDNAHSSKLFGNNSAFGSKAGKSGLKFKNKSQEIFCDGLTKEQYFSQIKNAAAAVRERAAKKRNYFTFITQEDDPTKIVANIRDDFEKQIYRQEILLDDIYPMNDEQNNRFYNIFEPTHRLATQPDPSIVVPIDQECEELRKKLLPIYGNNSFGLDYALSIAGFTNNCEYGTNLVTSLLDVLTGQKHRTVQNDFNKLLNKNIPK